MDLNIIGTMLLVLVGCVIYSLCPKREDRRKEVINEIGLLSHCMVPVLQYYTRILARGGEHPENIPTITQTLKVAKGTGHRMNEYNDALALSVLDNMENRIIPILLLASLKGNQPHVIQDLEDTAAYLEDLRVRADKYLTAN